MSHNCRTDGAIYECVINRRLRYVRCMVILPPGIDVSEDDQALIQRMHDGMEAALAPLFPQYPPKEAP